MQPVDLRLDVGGRVGILMAEQGEEIRQETAHDPDGPCACDALGFQALMAELGQRSEDGQIAHEERSTTQDNNVLRHGACKEFAAGRPIGKIRVHLEDF